VEIRGGVPTEVLVDAKGRYKRFIEAETGGWKEFWEHSQKSGLRKIVQRAERQVRVANGRPIEWWCAELATARAFRDEVDNNPKLTGRIRVRYKPMPQQDG